jgi:hypothetical protein
MVLGTLVLLIYFAVLVIEQLQEGLSILPGGNGGAEPREAWWRARLAPREIPAAQAIKSHAPRPSPSAAPSGYRGAG